MVCEVYKAPITVIDVDILPIAILRLNRSAPPILFDLDDTAVNVIVNLPLGTAITVTAIAFARPLIVNFTLGGVMGNTAEFSSGNDGPATGDSVLLVNTELSHLLTNLIFAVGAILIQTLALFTLLALNIRALILLRSPVAITEMIGVAGNPCVHASRSRLVSRVHVGVFLIVTVEGDFWSVGQLLALGVILDDFPVLFNRDVDIAEFDLPLLSFLDLCQLLPLYRQNEAVFTSRVNIGDNPDVFNIGSDNLFEGFEGQLLFISPISRGLFGFFIGDGEGLGQECHIILFDFKKILGLDNTLLERRFIIRVYVDDSDGRIHYFAGRTSQTCEQE